MSEQQRERVVETVRSERVIGIIRRGSSVDAIEHGRCLFEAGLRVIEVSFTTPNAEQAIDALLQLAPAGAFVGAGTVLNVALARRALAAGAQLLVAPNLDPAVVACAHDAGVAVVPGVATATETVQAMALGADLVKLFPASSVGPSGMAAILEAMPDVPYVPTGGVTIEDALIWFAAGAVAVGMGASLASGTRNDIAERASLLRFDGTAAIVR